MYSFLTAQFKLLFHCFPGIEELIEEPVITSIHLFVRPFICSIAYSFVRSSIHLFIRPFIHSLAHSFVRSPIHHLFVRPFIYSFVHSNNSLLVTMFLLFFTQVPPVGIILLVDLVLTVSRDFSFSFLYNGNKRFDFYSNWPIFFPFPDCLFHCCVLFDPTNQGK